MKNFRLLRADEIECRVSRCTEKGVAILLYKTARTDADLLDETYGAEFWENDFKLIDGVLYGGIGIDYDRAGEHLVWKWDAGTESNTEAEKGRASDAFKRAGFKHGIGRELYSAPFIWIPANKCKKLEMNKVGKWVCNDSFSVAKIEYDSQERISGLVIRSGREAVWDWGFTEEPPQTAEKPSDSWAKGEIFCEACGKPIIGHTAKDGTFTTADEIARRSKAATGKQLCVKCGREAMKNESPVA